MNLSDLIPWSRGRHDLAARGADPFFALQGRMNQLFDDFFRGVEGGLPNVFGRSGGLSLDVVETPEEYRVEAELPGVDEKDVRVTLTGDVLSIEGEKKSEQRAESEGSLRRERSFGRFQRSLTLPAEVDREKVDASFEKGVLTVRLPKTREALQKARTIEIKPGK